MIDPKDQESPVDEMSLALKAQSPVFHAVEDYRAALRFLILRYPKLQEILADWSNMR